MKNSAMSVLAAAVRSRDHSAVVRQALGRVVIVRESGVVMGPEEERWGRNAAKTRVS